MNSESFEITLYKIQFSPIIKRTIKMLWGTSMGVVFLTQFILYLPISIDLKALLLDGPFYVELLIGSGILFFIGYLLVYAGGSRKYKGYLRITSDQLEFNLNKKPFKLSYSEIDKIQYYLSQDEQWQWNFVTASEKFTIKFSQIVGRYNADNLLRGFLKEDYDKLVNIAYAGSVE